MRHQVKSYAELFVKKDRIRDWVRVIKIQDVKRLPRINPDWKIITELMLVAREVLDETKRGT